jgi:hypothetical protein
MFIGMVELSCHSVRLNNMKDFFSEFFDVNLEVFVIDEAFSQIDISPVYVMLFYRQKVYLFV